MEGKDRVTDLVGDLLGKSRHQSPRPRQAESKVQSQKSPLSQQSPHTLAETGTGVLARQEAITLSKDWGEAPECVPAAEGDRVPVQSPSSNAGNHREVLAEAEVVRLARFVFERYGDDAASPEIQADLAEVATLYRKDPVRWSQYWGERTRACGNT
jgi:hypothetical protein